MPPSESRARSLMAAVASPPPVPAWDTALKMLGASGEPAGGVPPKLETAGKPGDVGNLASARKGSLTGIPG